jgi:hypothetical protein
MMTSSTRQREDYMYFPNQIKAKWNDQLIFGTDGEFALESTFESVFPIEDFNNIHLHVEDCIKKKLKKCGMENDTDIVTTLLGKRV